MRFLAALATGLCRGCVTGSVARRMAALCLVLSTRRGKGSKLAIESVMSVAVVFIAPVIIRAALCCIVANFAM